MSSAADQPAASAGCWAAAGGAPLPVRGGHARGVLAGSLAGVVAVIVFSLVVNALLLTVPIYLMQVSDRVLVSQSRDTLVMLTVVALGALATLSALDFFRRMLLSKIGLRLETALGGAVLAASVQAKLAGNSAGNETQPLRDLAHVRSFLSSPVVPLMIDLPVAPAYIAVIFLIHPALGVIAGLGALVLLALALVNQAATARVLAEAGRENRAAFARAETQTRNAEAVASMGMLPQCVHLWGEANARALCHQARANRRHAMVSGLAKFTRLVLQIGLLGWGAWLALQGEITAGMMIAASIIGSRALQPIEGAIEGWRSFGQARQAYARVRDLLRAHAAAAYRTQLPAPEGRVSADKLWLVPPGSNEPILRNLSFEIAPGTILGLVGPTGAGKSSLLRLLVGALRPSNGTVRLDGADLRTWDPLQLGGLIGYLPQDVELFPGTVAANIARLRPDATGDEAVAAARFAGAHDLVVGLRNGYETEVFLDGAPLSGGQRQRIALARAFFGAPKFVVLDEPDASLDADGNEALGETLARARAAGITVVVATQKRTLLRHVDRVMALRNGQMVDVDALDEAAPPAPRRQPAGATASNVTKIVRPVLREPQP